MSYKDQVDKLSVYDRIMALPADLEWDEIREMAAKIAEEAVIVASAEAIYQVGSDIGEFVFLAKNRGEVNGFNMAAQHCGERAKSLMERVDRNGQ